MGRSEVRDASGRMEGCEGEELQVRKGVEREDEVKCREGIDSVRNGEKLGITPKRVDVKDW